MRHLLFITRRWGGGGGGGREGYISVLPAISDKSNISIVDVIINFSFKKNGDISSKASIIVGAVILSLSELILSFGELILSLRELILFLGQLILSLGQLILSLG